MNYQHKQTGKVITGAEYFKLPSEQREQFKQTEKDALNCKVKTDILSMEMKDNPIRIPNNISPTVFIERYGRKEDRIR